MDREKISCTCERWYQLAPLLDKLEQIANEIGCHFEEKDFRYCPGCGCYIQAGKHGLAKVVSFGIGSRAAQLLIVWPAVKLLEQCSDLFFI